MRGRRRSRRTRSQRGGAAENLLRLFILPAGSTGMCYRVTYFLHLHLAEKGVVSTPVVGWMTDGRDDLAMSHAWIEINGKKVDLTLANVAAHGANNIGEVIILDRAVHPGSKYDYFRQKNAKHLAAEAALSGSENLMMLAHKTREHAEMTKRATDPKDMRNWLDGAPDRLTYERLTAIVES